MVLVEVRFWIDDSATMVFLVKDPEDMDEIEGRVEQGLKERGFEGVSHGVIDVGVGG